MRKWPFKESSVQYGIVGVERSGFGDENVTSMTRRQNHWGPVLRLPSLRAPVVLTPLTEAWMNQKKWDAASEKKWSASGPLRYGLTHRLCLTHTNIQMHTYCICTFICCLFQGHIVHYAPQSLWDINKSDSETSTRDKTKHVRQQLTGCVRRK